MRPELWKRLNEVFDEVSKLPAAEREERVRRACGDEPELLEEALALIGEADQVETEFLDHPLADRALSLIDSSSEGGRIGGTVGSWRLVEEIGRGGMGVVYRAERVDGGFRQQGALKMVAGRPGGELLRRFADERQMLARLTHPGIARLLDGGATDDGLPFLVMEYVEGETITDHCARRRLTVEERIDLVLAICAAVQSAHQNLIIHRDLKPSNVLVDADGEPKLLDFGIAKLLDRAGESAGLTVAPALTPGYASPEQLENRPVSTASDVFSLGILLYELLTGRRPFGAPGDSMVEISQRLREGPPAPPSTVVTRPGQTGAKDPEEVGRERRSSPAGLRRRLAGDLDAIVLKALRLEPEHRYATVEALAGELGRERDGLPVRARGEALSYRVSRFASRHRVALGSSLLVALSLLVATVFSLQQARTAVRERDKSARVVAALERILWSPNPDWYADGGSAKITMAAVLKSAGKWLPESLADLPEEEARVRYSLGTTLASLGELEESERELRRADELHRQVWGDSHVETAKASAALGGVLHRRGRHAPAVEEFRRVLEICETADCDGFLDYLVPGTYWALGLALAGTGDEAGAEEALHRGLELRRGQGYEADVVISNIIGELGKLQRDRGELDEAEDLVRESLTTTDPMARLGARTHLGVIFKLRGRLSEARELIEEARQAASDILGPGHYFLGLIDLELAHVELREGAVEPARETIRRALELLESALDKQSRALGRAQTIHGEILLAAGEMDAAGRELEQAVDGLERSLPADHWELAEARSLLGEWLVRQGRTEAGLELLISARDKMSAKLGASDPRSKRAAERLERAG